MFVIIIILLSILLQLVAAFTALRLIKVTGNRWSWVFIAVAMVLQASTRALTLIGLINGQLAAPEVQTSELIGLVLSVLMAVGVVSIEPFFMAQARSIAERKKAEDALRESEEQYRSLVESFPYGIAITSEMKIVYINQAGAKIHGAASPSEIIGKSILEVIPPEHREYVKEHVGNLEKGEVVPVMEDKLLRLDGTVVDVELGAIPFNYLGKAGNFAVFRDITERKQAENRLWLLCYLLNQSSDSIFVVDAATGRITNVNDGACRMLQYSRDELLQLNIVDIQTALRDAADWEAHVRQLQTSDRMLLEFEARPKQGAFIPVEVNTRYIVVAGTPNIIAVVRDITERKRAEDELKKTQFQLIKSGKLAAMGELAAGITHELTQPLLGISGFAAALLEDLNNFKKESAISDHDIRKFMEQSASDLEIIRQQTDRMTKIINAVRTFAHESGTGAKLIEINPQIEKILVLFSQQLRNHNITLVKNLATGLPQIFGNADELQQVMINLITNAREAMKAKGKGGQLTITTGKSDSGIYIELEDTGTGADAQTLSRMFEPFFTTKKGGMGLGLSIVHRIITDHGGTINVECQEGAGCKFTIRLPSGGINKNG